MLNRCPICASIKITAFVPKKRGMTKQVSGGGGRREADEGNIRVGGAVKAQCRKGKTDKNEEMNRHIWSGGGAERGTQRGRGVAERGGQRERERLQMVVNDPLLLRRVQ